MPYCLSCGKFHPDRTPFCKPCSGDFAITRKADEKVEHQRLMREVATNKQVREGA